MTVGLWLFATAVPTLSFGETAVLRLPALCNLSLEELLAIRVEPDAPLPATHPATCARTARLPAEFTASSDKH